MSEEKKNKKADDQAKPGTGKAKSPEAQAKAAEARAKNEAKGKGEGKAKGEGKGEGKGKPKGDAKAKGPKEPQGPAVPPRMRDKFRNEVLPKIRQEFDIKNAFASPKLVKVMLTVGIGKQLEGTKLNSKAKEQVLADLTVISGQKPVVTKAKKSVANFKLRAGYEIGAMVTLRGARMWEFIDRLISISIPRIKDFRGVKTTSFDGRGNYSFGITEQGIFPEVNMADAQFTHGMNITFVFSNSTNERSRAVLKELGMPFALPEEKTKQQRPSN